MSRDEWKELRSRILKQCAICGKDIDEIAGSVHHLLKRSQGGDDVPENLVPLCGHGTSGCHGDIEARRQPALSRLRDSLAGSQVEYLARKKDDDWINRHYPNLPYLQPQDPQTQDGNLTDQQSNPGSSSL